MRSLIQKASRAVFASKEYARAVRGRMIGKVPCDISKGGPFTIARAHFLNKSQVDEFVAECKSEGFKPIFSSYEDLVLHKFESSTVVMRLDKDISNQINKKQRWAYKKAEKEGVSVVLSSDKKDWQAYLTLFKSMLMRKNVKFDLDEAAFWSQYESELVQLYVAKYKGRVIAGGEFFVSKPFVYYFSGSVDTDYYSLQPMPLILKVVADTYKSKKFTVFDLGGCKVNAKKGSEEYRINRFKEGFGELVTYYDYYPSKLLYWLKRIKDVFL